MEGKHGFVSPYCLFLWHVTAVIPLLHGVSVPLLQRLLVSLQAWGPSLWADYWERRHRHGPRVSESDLL